MPRATSVALALAFALVPGAGTPVGAEPPASFQDEYLTELDWAAERLRGLAEAIPADRYDWRPAEGVRSVAEAFQHVNASAYLLLGRAGTAPPEGVPDDVQALETVTDKDRVVAELERAVGHVRKAVEAATPEELDREVELFGRQTTVRGVLLRLLVHWNEHTGQLVAYARSLGVTPPWSRPAE